MTGRRQAGWVRTDRGQAVPAVVIALAIAVVTVVVVARTGEVVVDRARARTAADAAALAGAEAGRAAAEDEARANGATLEAWAVVGGATQVTVRVGRARATARARPGPPRSGRRWAPVGRAATGVSPRLAP